MASSRVEFRLIMEQGRREKVKEVFYSALNRPKKERGAYLDEVCSDDHEFRNDVEILLNSYNSGFLEDNVWPDSISERTIAPPCLTPGDELSHYEIIRMLGRGGMGEVYLARDKILDRHAAIKILHDDAGHEAKTAKRLLREARSAAGLDHPNICSVYEVGEISGRPFIAMQYVEGRTLQEILKDGPVKVDKAVSIIQKIASALIDAHSRGVIHRDIKPSNIIIDDRGNLRVLDFGLAKRTVLSDSNSTETDLSEAGVVAGTIAFMSPEQARGLEIDVRTDIWSLGVVFYQLITGRLPFAGNTNVDTIAAILHDSVQPPNHLNANIPHNVDTIIRRALEKDRDDRFQSVDEFENALVSDGSASTATVSFSNLGSLRKKIDRLNTKSRWIRIAFAGVLAIVVATSVAAWWLSRSKRIVAGTFSAGNAGKLQISKLYSTKRNPNSMISGLRFSPDGKLISYVLSGDGKNAIYIKPVDGGDPIRITDGKSFEHSPVWSSDGQRIAFVSDRNGKPAIWSVSFLGGLPILLTSLEGRISDYDLTKWSNDGGTMFVGIGGKLKTISLSTGKISEVNLAGIEGEIEGNFAISPDENQAAVISVENDKENIWIKSLATGRAIRISESGHHSWAPNWFPDNERVAYSSDQNGNFQIYVRDINDSDARQVTFGDFNSSEPVVSPDGRRIAYISTVDEANIYGLRLDTRKEAALTSNVNMQLFANVARNGKQYVYQTTDDVAKVLASRLKIGDLDSGINSITELGVNGCCARWSSDGGKIVYFQSAGTDRNLWQIDVSSRKTTKLTSVGVSLAGFGVAPFDLSAIPFDLPPDGTGTVFVSRKNGNSDVWQSDSNGEQNLTNFQGPINAISPIFSPVDKQIAFIQATGMGPLISIRSNRIAFYRNGEIVLSAEIKDRLRMIGWASNGSGVFVGVANGDGVEVRFLTPDGETRKIARLSDARLDGISISPDRRLIAYIARTSNTDNIFVASVRTGQAERMTVNEEPTLFYSGLTWTPDSKSLLYSKQSGGIHISLISDAN